MAPIRAQAAAAALAAASSCPEIRLVRNRTGPRVSTIPMGNVSSRIWRTVVFAGAMLATPLAGCASGTHKQTTPEPTPAPAEQQTVVAPPHDEAAAQREADAKAAQEEADLLAAQKLAEEEAARQAQAEADQKRLEEARRIRGSGGGPRGRGFVLS